MPRFAFHAPACFAAGLALLWAFAFGATPARAETSVDDFRAKMEKWVETRQVISKERTDWEVEQQTLRASRDLLRDQQQALQAEIAELEESQTQADEERRDLLLQRGEYQRGSRALEDRIRSMEQAVLEIAPRLPEPLQGKLEPLLVQIPEDPEKGKPALSQRLMNVLGVLAQAEKFNGTATFVAETRPMGDQKVQVRTLYWGLGQAFYVDAQGRSAGVGHPGADGWEFHDQPGIAGDTRRLLDIYEGDLDVIQFVEMPTEIR